jgi:hypothetical protein
VIALYISMMIWMIISVVFAAQYFNYDSYGWHSKMAMSYVNGFFHALSFIILLCYCNYSARVCAGYAAANSLRRIPYKRAARVLSASTGICAAKID